MQLLNALRQNIIGHMHSEMSSFMYCLNQRVRNTRRYKYLHDSKRTVYPVLDVTWGKTAEYRYLYKNMLDTQRSSPSLMRAQQGTLSVYNRLL